MHNSHSDWSHLAPLTYEIIVLAHLPGWYPVSCVLCPVLHIPFSRSAVPLTYYYFHRRHVLELA